MEKQRIILSHNENADKLPQVDSAKLGELFVNCASGDGKTMLITKKTDDTLVTFHEDYYWQHQIDEKFTNVIHTDDVGVLSAVTADCEIMIKDDEGYKKTAIDTFCDYLDSVERSLVFEYDEDTNILNITGTKSNMEYDNDTKILNITL